MVMGFSGRYDFDEKERQSALIDESRVIQQRGLMEVQHPYNHNGVKNDAVFWPVEHPMEPPDEDQPVQCPMPESSVINDGRMHEKRFSQNTRKRVEVPTTKVDRERTAATSAVSEDYHTLTQRHDNDVITPLVTAPPIPPLPTQNVPIFQMLQKFDDFES